MGFTKVTASGITTGGSFVLENINTSGIITTTEINVGSAVTLSGSGINATGVITARSGVKIQTGTATTALIVEGDSRVTGILTIGNSSITLDGTNNTAQVGTALTLGHTQGIQYHTQNLHAGGFEVNNINASGIITATAFNGDGSNLTGINGFSSALANSGPLNNIFKNSKTLEVTAGIHTVNSDAASDNLAFMRESIIHVAAGATFHIGSGTTLRTNILNLF